jgi:hypothetical protein
MGTGNLLFGIQLSRLARMIVEVERQSYHYVWRGPGPSGDSLFK